MYYVYEWFDKKTNKVFYVGKGCRLRYKVRKHNKLFNEYLKNNDCDTRIIKYFKNEGDAFAYEYERVCELKAKGECECNINKAGGGGSTKWWTPELREYYSKHNIMKSQKQRERMSKNNPMKDKKTCMKVNSQKRKPIIINGVRYVSIKQASDCLGISTSWIGDLLHGKSKSDKYICKYDNQ